MKTIINGKTYSYDYKLVALHSETIKLIKEYAKSHKLTFMNATDELIKKGIK